MNIVLVDGKWVAYRMHFSHLSLKTSDGKPTGMLYGFMHELIRINKKWPTAVSVICWDGEGPTWRHKLYPPYKQNRQPNPEMPRMKQGAGVLIPLLQMLGFRVLKRDGIEADDMIGMAATRLACDGNEIRIHSADQDMYQLVRGSSVTVWPKLDEKPLTEKDVKKVFGVEPIFISEIRALAGDSSDNLKGLMGVGPKTALKLWKSGMKPESPIGWGDRAGEQPRVEKEYQLSKIIRDTNSRVWSVEQREYLTEIMERIAQRPGRDWKHAEKNREEVYRLLARYELSTLIADRHTLFSLP